LKLVCQYPEVQGLEGHLFSIQQEIDSFRPTRLVLDSVSALDRVPSALLGIPSAHDVEG
jgi:circadian clock protein KaiC